MLILHQFKLMTSNGIGIILILVERIKRYIAQTWEGLQRTTVRIEIKVAKAQFTRNNWKTNEDT